MKGLTTRESYTSSLYSIEEFSVIGTCQEQEDYTGCILDGNVSVMVLCDGIGGLERGNLASRTAVKTILSMAAERNWKENPTEYLMVFLQEANEAVFNLRDECGRLVESGCTIVLILTVGRKIYVANVGDSRAYLIKKDGMVKLTKDHNLANQLARQLAEGEISQKEYDSQIERGGALISYIGMGRLSIYHVTEEPILLDRDEVILIESDGLYKLVGNQEVFRIVRNKVRRLDEAGEELLETAEQRVAGYQDNTSLIMLRIK